MQTHRNSVKIQKISINSHRAIDMMIFYKITKVNLCMSLRKNHDVSVTEKDAVVYRPCLDPHKKLIVTTFVFKRV